MEATEPQDRSVIRIKKIRIWQALTVIFAVLFIVSVLTNGFRFSNTGAAVVGSQKENQITVSTDDDPAKGDPNAPVVMIEFSDYQCPYCQRYVLQTYPEIIKNYVNTGKVYYVFRDFPLSFHKHALAAAIAAECAGEQGKYWEMHDKLFENSYTGDSWATMSNEEANQTFKDYAEELGLDMDKFNSCFNSAKYQSEIQKDFKDGISYGVKGTPTFFINGKMIIGAQPYEKFEEAIEKALTE